MKEPRGLLERAAPCIIRTFAALSRLAAPSLHCEFSARSPLFRFILHPSSFRLPASGFILALRIIGTFAALFGFILHPSAFILPPSSFILPPSS